MEKLLSEVQNGNCSIGVVGIGRVGLPLALVLAQSGFRVFGIDKDYDYVKKLINGEAPFHEDGVTELLGLPNFMPVVTSKEIFENCSVLILCVGTPINQNYNPDYSQVFSALDEILMSSIKGKLIIIRSTIAPGTIEDKIIPYLESKSGLKAGVDFGIASCPERIVEGRAIEEIKKLPEIIGGINEISTAIASIIFKKINPDKVILRTTPKVAELAKLFTNVYRYVNFALANEFALLSERLGEDASEIIRILNTGYPRGGVPMPGMAGGPCLTKDGYFLLSDTAFPDFVLLASRLNEFIPQHIVNQLKKALKDKGKLIYKCKVAVLGLAFKAGIDDVRYSPSAKMVNILETETFKVSKHDPYIPHTESLKDAIVDADAVVLATNHPEFKNVHKDICFIGGYKQDCIFYDCWGMVGAEEAEKLGFTYMRFGKGKNE